MIREKGIPTAKPSIGSCLLRKRKEEEGGEGICSPSLPKTCRVRVEAVAEWSLSAKVVGGSLGNSRRPTRRPPGGVFLPLDKEKKLGSRISSWAWEI